MSAPNRAQKPGAEVRVRAGDFDAAWYRALKEQRRINKERGVSDDMALAIYDEFFFRTFPIDRLGESDRPEARQLFDEVIALCDKIYTSRSVKLDTRKHIRALLRNVKRLDIIFDYASVINSNNNIEIYIPREITIKIDANAFMKRLADIDQFAKENPGAPISEKILELIPEISNAFRVEEPRAPRGLPLPEKPPAKWSESKLPSETPPAFIKRHYAAWLDGTLTRSDVRRLDPQLYMALSNWLRSNAMPADIDLPTLKEANDRWVRRIEAGVLPAEPRDLIRLALAKARRSVANSLE